MALGKWAKQEERDQARERVDGKTCACSPGADVVKCGRQILLSSPLVTNLRHESAPGVTQKHEYRCGCGNIGLTEGPWDKTFSAARS
jgi:hypothetical protein